MYGTVGEAPERESAALWGDRFRLVPQDGQGYVFRDHVFDGLRRREAP